MRNRSVLLGVCALFVFWAVAIGSAQNYQGLQITAEPSVQNTGNNSAVVNWSTNQPSATTLRFGTNPNNLDNVAEGQSGTTMHQVMLQNLQPNTTYYIQAISQGPNGYGQSVSPIMQFTSSNGQVGSNGHYNQSGAYQNQSGYYPQQGYDNQPAYNNQPVASNRNLQITGGPNVNSVSTNQATVTWETNAPSSSVVKYGTNPDDLSQTAQQPWGATNHQVQLNNLNPNTTYYFQVRSGQAQGTGTLAQSGTSSFQTPQ